MKRPAFQFYPADWRKDSALQSCSIAARGLWIELLCVMHECEPYGVLAINGRPMQPAQVARLVGESEKVVRSLLDEIEAAGVFSRDESGAIFSRRMLKDERIRLIRASAGRLGGNPNLVKQKDNQGPKQHHKQAVKHGDKPEPTPSSSSSTSESPIGDSSPPTPPQAGGEDGGSKPAASKAGRETAPRAVTMPPWLPAADWQAFVEHRRRLRAPMTEVAQARAIAELDRLRTDGHDPLAVINQSIINGWKGLFPLHQRTAPALAPAVGHQEVPRDVVSRF